MAELADPAVSELHQMASKKAQELSIALEKYEKFRNIISENMADFIELSRVNAELKEVEVLVADEEGGGYGSLKELESELKTEKENSVMRKHYFATKLQNAWRCHGKVHEPQTLN